LVTQHKFEIPWNGDLRLVDGIIKEGLQDKVKFFFIPALRDDSNSTRRYENGDIYDKFTFEKINEYVMERGFNLSVLLQRDVNIDSIPFYYNLGIRHFTVGPDKVAEYLREHYDDVYITGSITKALIPTDYEKYSQEKPDLYDIFILGFEFSRNLSIIKKLPTNLKYGIMPNNTCLWYCPYMKHHWFPDIYGDFERGFPPCGEERNKFENGQSSMNMENIMFIPPENLYLFDPYIESYKLIDRTAPTFEILTSLKNYSSIDLNIQFLPETDYDIGGGVFKRRIDPVY
jgi:hypothetical protein